MLYGYAGKVLHVDLTSGTIDIEQPAEEFYRTYVGGSAMGLYYLFRNTPVGADPLGPDNTLTYALAGITGAPIAGQSRATAVAKSPVTGGAGDSQAGGFWPAELKFAGFDGIVITGRSPEPVYLWIKEGKAELRPAGHLWGKTTREVDAQLKEELGESRAEIAQIGPAGERLVRFAAVMNMANRAHGRTGMGAVMGSKNLRAIAVRGGKKKLPMADPEGLRAFMQGSRAGLTDNPNVASLAQYGTLDILEFQNESGGLPTRNYRSGYFGDKAAAISGAALFDTYLRGADEGTQMKTGRDTCYSCAVRCKRVVEAEWEGNPIDPLSGGQEYETTATFGSYCGIDDHHAIAYANQLCNQYGVDTIAAGATMAFAIDCFEAGIIGPADTGGIELGWGNTPAMLQLLEQTLKREGFGDVLADGSAMAAERIGRGAVDLTITVKGSELPAHMPHVKRSLALIYAVNPFGADHQSHEHDPSYEPETFETSPEYVKRMGDLGLTDPQDPWNLTPEKVRYSLTTQYVFSAMDTTNVCQFVYGPGWELMGTEELAGIITAVTGIETSIDDVVTMGKRRLNMLRAFNAREGLDRDHDTLPNRLFDEPLVGGVTDGMALDRPEFEAALDEYYRQAGWTPTGTPTAETLTGLGLEWIAEQIGT